MTAFGSTSLYNPHQLKKEDLIGGFVARRPLLYRLVEDVRREKDGAPQHHLIIGQRGQGKTSLLRRLAFEIEDDETLSAVWKPLVFPEEQYNVSNLGDFWMNCVDAMSDALERAGDKAAAANLDARLASAGRGAAGLALLLGEAARIGRRLVLLVDNIDIVLDRIGKDEEWEFRRVISSEPRLLIVGASSRAQEAFYDHGRAFYDFFQVHELRGLDDAETFQVLRDLAARTGEHRVSQLLDQQPGRIKALRELTGGNPRTLTLLFRVLAQGPEANVEADIEQLLDQYTPLYKDRIEDLPTQAQQVIDAMALHWDPLTAAMLAERVRLPVNQVSAQLKRLEDLGVVERADWHGEKKIAFQIAERFFNIWYLMRASRRLRRQLLWLVRFLESWFGPEQLSTHARDYLRRDPDAESRQRYATMSFALSERMEDRRLRSSLEHAALHAAVEDERVRRMFDFSDLRPELLDKKKRMEHMAELRGRALSARADWGAIDPSELWRLLGGSLFYSAQEKEKMVEQLTGLSVEALSDLHYEFGADERRLLTEFPQDRAAVGLLYDALAQGHISDAYDWESSSAEAERRGQPSMPTVAILSRVSAFTNRGAWTDTDASKAAAALTEMIKGQFLPARAWYGLGFLQSARLALFHEARESFDRAIEIDCGYAKPWYGRGHLLEIQERFGEAADSYRRALELDEQDAQTWYKLGMLLEDRLKKPEEAEQAYRKAIEAAPTFGWAWNGLGSLQTDLGRLAEAETSFRRAAKLDPRDPWPWNNLGVILRKQPERFTEAEQAFRKAIEIQPTNHKAWRNLGKLLVKIGGRDDSAGEAFLKAYSLMVLPEGRGDELIEMCEDLAAQEQTRQLAAGPLREALTLSPGIGLSLAAGLILTRRYDAAKCVLLRLAKDQSAFRTEVQVEPFQAIVNAGLSSITTVLLKETGGDQRWRPLYEALRAAAEGDRKYLRRVAPEVRRVAEEIYDRIAPQKGEGAP